MSTALSEQDSVRSWRLNYFTALGCSPEVAVIASQLPSWALDLHEVEKLVDAGCDPDVAIDILA